MDNKVLILEGQKGTKGQRSTEGKGKEEALPILVNWGQNSTGNFLYPKLVEWLHRSRERGYAQTDIPNFLVLGFYLVSCNFLFSHFVLTNGRGEVSNRCLLQFKSFGLLGNLGLNLPLSNEWGSYQLWGTSLGTCCNSIQWQWRFEGSFRFCFAILGWLWKAFLPLTGRKCSQGWFITTQNAVKIVGQPESDVQMER